jgi:hypothetical protein
MIACDAKGTAYIAELGRPGILRRDPKGALATFAPGSPKQRTPLHAVSALAVDAEGTLFAGDRATGEIYRVDAGKAPIPLSGGAFEIPTGLAVTTEGDLIVCDLRLAIVSRLPRDGGRPRTLAEIPAPRGVAVAAKGDIVVLSAGPDQLVRISGGGEVRPIIKGRPFKFPLALLRDQDHDRYLVSDGDAATVWAVSESGDVQAWAKGIPLLRPEGLARDPAGAIVVADPRAAQVFRISTPAQIQPWLESP